jgi:hypothetical protein
VTVDPRLRSPLVVLVTLAALALATAPAVVAFGLGWMELGWDQDRDGIGALVDENSIEAWTALALAFLVWVPLVLAALIVVLDRIGRHYTPREHTPRRTKRERRRLQAGLRYMTGRQASPSPKPRRDRRDDGEG